jgi:hypothetical protein
LNEALQSRFNFAEVGYMDEKDEIALLEGTFTSPPAVGERRLVRSLMTFAQESRSGEWEYALSVRDLVYSIRLHERIGTPRMLRILEAKFDPEHREAIRGRLQSAFAVNPAAVELWQCS